MKPPRLPVVADRIWVKDSRDRWYRAIVLDPDRKGMIEFRLTDARRYEANFGLFEEIRLAEIGVLSIHPNAYRNYWAFDEDIVVPQPYLKSSVAK